MALSSPEFHLPPSVEQMLQKICREQFLSSPDFSARKVLHSLGEEGALCLLRKISTSSIKNLSALITYMARNASPSKRSPCSPDGRPTTPSNGSPYSPGGRPTAACRTLLYESGPSNISPKRPRRLVASPQMLALGELEFRKMFTILSYLGKKRPEDFLSTEKIRELKNLPMATFEAKVWQAVGVHCISKDDRSQLFDWDGALSYCCDVDPDGKITYKGPYLDKTRSHLQRVLGDENVLNVRFADEAVEKRNSTLTLDHHYASFYNLPKEGIPVGLRCYRFFVFKDGGKEAKRKSPTSSSVKCYFVCTESNAAIDEEKPYILFGKSIYEARCMFMHVHTVANIAKYMARFSLILSKTIKLEIDLDSVSIERIADIPCMDEEGNIMYDDGGDPLVHTDGTGFISEDLALKCPKKIYKGFVHGVLERTQGCGELERCSLNQINSLIGEPPLLIQCRLFNNGCAIKGTLLINKRLPPKTIQIRPSMVKVETDPKLSNVPTFNSLEIVSTSNQPKKTYLSKYLIALLNYGGVPKEYFMDLLKKALDDTQIVQSNKRAAWKVAQNYGEMDDFLTLRMIASGIPLEEPYLRHHLSVLMKEEKKSLKGGKLPVSECYYLMGTADPTGTLNTNEVAVILDNGQISGNVLLFKHPGIHFGDIHVVTATYVKDLESFVGNAKYAIFFPTKGPRSIADEIANSDFDGDMYWVSRNPQLLDYFKPSKPWERSSTNKKLDLPGPTQFFDDELEKLLFRRFLLNRFHSSSAVGAAAVSWLAYMDRLLTIGDDCAKEQCLQEKMLKLINIYYDALDAPKSGMKITVPENLQAKKFPHFMERERKDSYDSTSILGMIYDKVNSYTLEDSPSEEVHQLPCFSEQAPASCLEKWKNHYENYREEMSNVLCTDNEYKDATIKKIFRKYKQELYEATEFEESTKNREDIFNEACAIYQVCYNYAAKRKDKRKCGFAWKVAGHALCSLYLIKQNNISFPCSLSALREVIG